MTAATVATIVFTADDAVEKARTQPVVLVRKETVPDDIHGMEIAKGTILTMLLFTKDIPLSNLILRIVVMGGTMAIHFLITIISTHPLAE